MSAYPRIVFMGTPEFAVPSLDRLLQAGYPVIAVVTAPDKPAGRGMQLTGSAIKKFAQQHQLPVLQPDKLKAPDFIASLKSLGADLQVVVAFRMLPEIVWDMPPLGTINVHASLLPKYRGAAPINWAIINGEKETGVTTFKLTHAIDTGNILLQEKVAIGNSETAGELHNKLMEAGATLLIKTLDTLRQDGLTEQPQETLLRQDWDPRTLHAPKIFRDTCRINWHQPADTIYNHIRGLSPVPGAFTHFQEKQLKIYRAEKHHASHTARPGSFETDHKSYLRFVCTDGYIYATELQAEGKKRMEITAFLRGYR